MRDFALSVPANLLLIGEYAVTEEGGRGIALATAPRVGLRAVRAPALSIRGKMGPASMEWTEGGGARPPALVAACLDLVRARLGELGLPSRLGPLAIDIDSSAFFGPDGSKRGFGSSAAVAVSLVAALLRSGGLEGRALEEEVFPLALAAHRGAQGGRGSGYDVAASRFGGAGHFVGGALPSWQALEAGRSPALGIFTGRGPVSTPQAILRYQAWRQADPSGHAAYLAESGALVGAFIAAAGPAERLDAIRAAALLGARLGDSIGVPARLDPPPGGKAAETRVFKALGAGDELGLVALSGGGQSGAGGGRPLRGPSLAEEGISPVEIEVDGLRWE